MYNLKVEAVNIMEKLEENGFEALFIGNYPFIKYHNSCHQDDKIKVKQFEVVTNAKADDLKNIFEKVRFHSEDYVKFAIIELEVKQNKLFFKVFYADDYTSIVSNKTKSINCIKDILDNRGFLLETLTMNKGYKIDNYVGKKIDAYQSIQNKVLHANGNFRERLLENPLVILQLCYYASNLNYQVNDAMLKIVTNNCQYLKYESIENINRYFAMILNSKNPIVGLKIIKDTMLNFEYNNIKIFEFLKDIPDEHLFKLSSFNDNIDTISRWSYLLLPLSIDKSEIILNNLKIKYKNKVIWLLQNSELIKQENYKMAIYNSRESLKKITESKWDVFLLFEMFDRLTKLYCVLDPERQDKCKKIIDTICSRPFFTYQIQYDDEDICKIANVEQGSWLESTKINFVEKLIMCDKHPDEDRYLELLKESIEFGLISSL